MDKITFFPLGNADTTLIVLKNGKIILWDYASTKTSEEGDKRCDLPTELNKRVKGDFDVVCFTHADEDHIKKMSEYFYLEHAEKYQGENRKKIIELWVPAAILVDTENKNDDDAILKAEARYRLKNGAGIKVFSKPDKLKDWLKKNEIDFEKIEHLIIDAGTNIPGWDKLADGIEFFVHSPFVGHINECDVVDRNDAGIIAQAIFGNRAETKFILGADAHADVWENIVKITKYHGNEDKLAWDIFHLPHHCSYKSLNGLEKGENKTVPTSETKWLFETKGNSDCLIVSPSDEIVFSDTIQPPHFQAYNYYKNDVTDKKNGVITVTMQHPSKSNPLPLVVEINDDGFSIEKEGLTEEEKIAGAKVIASKSIVTGNYCSN